MLSQHQIDQVKEIVDKFNPTMIAIFGSYARGDESSNSDLDILVDFEDRINLLEIVGLEQELTKELGIKVDLITVKSVHKRLKKHIERDLIRIK